MFQEFYIIRRKSDRWFLPETHGSYSSNEPVKHGVPRLFTSRKNAEGSLTQWLRGIHEQVWGTEEIFGRDCRVCEGIGVSKVMDRKREDMEIVPVELKDVFV